MRCIWCKKEFECSNICNIPRPLDNVCICLECKALHFSTYKDMIRDCFPNQILDKAKILLTALKLGFP